MKLRQSAQISRWYLKLRLIDNTSLAEKQKAGLFYLAYFHVGRDFKEFCRKYAWAAGALAGGVFVGVGIWQGQFEVILKKAVMICLECIGIG